MTSSRPITRSWTKARSKWTNDSKVWGPRKLAALTNIQPYSSGNSSTPVGVLRVVSGPRGTGLPQFVRYLLDGGPSSPLHFESPSQDTGLCRLALSYARGSALPLRSRSLPRSEEHTSELQSRLHI